MNSDIILIKIYIIIYIMSRHAGTCMYYVNDRPTDSCVHIHTESSI